MTRHKCIRCGYKCEEFGNEKEIIQYRGNIKDINCNKTNMNQIQFSQTEFENCDFTKSDFSDAIFSQVIFKDCDLRHTRIDRSDFSQVSFESTVIDTKIYSDVNIRNPNLRFNNPHKPSNNIVCELNDEEFDVIRKMRMEKNKSSIHETKKISLKSLILG